MSLGQIGILMGGDSSEREISLKSGRAVSRALKDAGHSVCDIDISFKDQKEALSQLKASNIDVAFIALHGTYGEDGIVQAILEEADIPYTGSGVEASERAMNKIIAYDLFKQDNIVVPTYLTVSSSGPFDSQRIIEQLKGYPLIIKPVGEGSSIGISIVSDQKHLNNALQHAFEFGQEILVEHYIEGKEVTVGILEEKPLPVVEIRPKNRFFDFTAKYEKGMTEYIVPAEIPDDVSKKVQQIAIEAHQALGCRDFSRVDFMLDANQQSYLLEVNTIPGFTSTSLLPMAAEEAGINFTQLCTKLIELAYAKKKSKKTE